MKFHLTGKYKLVNGTSKIVENGKQKIQIDSSITLRRHMMRKLVWKIKQIISKIKVKRHLKDIGKKFYGEK
jgi:hypothetical protein